ncbi:MAG: hypothetical protein HZA78_12260 [Candidatus Schekmanbacteria bacterium]|nr:hypothetical protein [Candidatus Schekmanbacteria bacterium]
MKSLFYLTILSITVCCASCVVDVDEPKFNEPQDTSAGPFQLAQAKDDVISYRKFVHNFPNSRFLPQAVERLGELLVAEGNKESLEAYVKSFPDYQHKVSEALHEIQLIELVNQHMDEDERLPADRLNLKIRRGELFYAHHYFKGFVKLEDAIGMNAEYEVRVEKALMPEFIGVELLPGVSFAMEEKFHAMTNIRYRLLVAQSAPLGKYKAEVTFAVYRKEGNKWVRRDGSGVVHEVEVLDNYIGNQDELDVDFRAVTYFREKAAEAQQTLNRLKPPAKDEFSEHYMYAYNLAEYTVRMEKYRTFQAIAYYHLQKAGTSSDLTLNQKAVNYLQKLGMARPEVEFVPVVQEK